MAQANIIYSSLAHAAPWCSSWPNLVKLGLITDLDNIYGDGWKISELQWDLKIPPWAHYAHMLIILNATASLSLYIYLPHPPYSQKVEIYNSQGRNNKNKNRADLNIDVRNNVFFIIPSPLPPFLPPEAEQPTNPWYGTTSFVWSNCLIHWTPSY